MWSIVDRLQSKMLTFDDIPRIEIDPFRSHYILLNQPYRQVYDLSLFTPDGTPFAPQPKARSHIRPRRIAGSSQRLFAMSRPIPGTLAAAYLRNRGITLLRGATGSLRFHPRCYDRLDEHSATETWPATIAAVTDLDGKLTGAHRTWLDPEGFSEATLGKAPIDATAGDGRPARQSRPLWRRRGISIGISEQVMQEVRPGRELGPLAREYIARSPRAGSCQPLQIESRLLAESCEIDLGVDRGGGWVAVPENVPRSP
jgi:hypothetical protein